MMSALTRLRDEAQRLLTTYEEHKDSPDESLRRKVHVDMDRFLMEHREIAMLLVVEGLQERINHLTAEKRKVPWFKKILKRGDTNADDNDNIDRPTIHLGQ